jgi:hypothetical protein
MTTQSESDARRQDERERQTAFGPGGKPSWWQRNFGGGDSRSIPSPEAADAWNRSQAEYEASGRAAAQRNRQRLDSQTRTEAYDPGADMFDPRNMKPVDYQGRTIWTNDYSNLPANRPQPATKLSSSGAITKKISPLVAQPSDTYDVPPDAYSPNRGIQPQFSDTYDVPPDQQPAPPYVATRYSDEDYLPPARPQTVASLPPYVLPSGVGMPYPPGTFDPRKPPAVTAGGPRFPLVGAGGASGGGGGGGGGGPRWDQRYANWRNQKLEGANQWLENKLDALGRWNGKVFAQGGPVGYAEGGSTNDDDDDGSVYNVPEAPHGGTFMPVTAFGVQNRMSPSRAVTSQAPAATPFAAAKSSSDGGSDMFGGLTKLLGPMLGGMMGGGGDGVTPSGPLGSGAGGAYTTADVQPGGILGSLGGGMGFGDIDMEIADWSGYAEGGPVGMFEGGGMGGGMPWMSLLNSGMSLGKHIAGGQNQMEVQPGSYTYDPASSLWDALDPDKVTNNQDQLIGGDIGRGVGSVVGSFFGPFAPAFTEGFGRLGTGIGALTSGKGIGAAAESLAEGTPFDLLFADGGRVPYAQGGGSEDPLGWNTDDGQDSNFMPATAFGGAAPNLSPSQAVIAQAPAAAPIAAPAGGGGGGGGGGMGDIFGMAMKLAPMAMTAFSDERLKENIKPVGKTKSGMKVIDYNYKGSPVRQRGLSAQDVEKKRPSAVGEVGGFKTVDYGKALKASGGPIGMMRGGYPELYTRAQRTAFSTGGGDNYVRPDGRGNGRSDHIDASLSPGEFVMDAETVSLAGDGDNNAGAREFEKLRKNLRAHKGKQLAKGKFSPKAKPVAAYMSGKLSAADRAAHAGVSDGMRQMGRR